jgi:ATP-dependent helicase/nuclease subunit A
LPDAPESVTWQESRDKKHIQEEIEFSWASEMARHVGNVVHRWLQKIAEDEMHKWNAARIQGMREQFTRNLIAGGISGDDQTMVYAVERIILALTNAIQDERGQWILGAQPFAQNELRISGIVNDKVIINMPNSSQIDHVP